LFKTVPKPVWIPHPKEQTSSKGREGSTLTSWSDGNGGERVKGKDYERLQNHEHPPTITREKSTFQISGKLTALVSTTPCLAKLL